MLFVMPTRSLKLLSCGTALLISSAACHSDSAAAAAEVRPPARVQGDTLILAANDPQAVSLHSVLVSAPTARTIPLNGRLAWSEDATARVFVPFAGRVTRITATVGETVRPGAELAAIASPDYGQAQADARRARTDAALAERTLSRQRDLLQHGIVAQKEVDAAEADLQRARAEDDRARARLALYGGDSASSAQVYTLRAPVSGVVVERNVNPGQEVRPDQMLASAPQLFAPLFVITDPARLWVILDVPERDTPSLRPGQPITLHARALADQTFNATIATTTGAIDPVSRTMKVRAVVNNPTGVLRAEMLVSADAAVAGPGDISVPVSSVILQGERHVVFVEQAHGKYARREVTVGAERNGMMPVVSGLRAGDRVVTTTPLLLQQLYDNARRT
jgi:cobalt-zinc-cadmium efflux system membrane fusion protein